MTRTQTKTVVLLMVVLLASAGIALAATTYFTASDTTFGVDGGPNVTIQGSVDVESGNPVKSGSVVNVSTDTSGWIRGESNVNTSISVAQIEGTYTKLDSIDVSNGNLTITTSDKSTPIKIKGGFSEFDYTSGITVDDGNVDFQYTSSGTSTVTIQNLPSDTTIAAIDPSSNEVLGSGTTNGAGTLVIELTNPNHAVELKTSDTGPTFANPSPTGKQDSNPTKFEVDVSDGDFPDDNVTVNIRDDGMLVHTENITSNQTVSTTNISSSYTGGQHNWSVGAEDSYGNVGTANYTFKVPDTFYLRNETNTSELVDLPVNTTVRFFGTDKVFSRSTSDGTINMTGLPVNQDFIVAVNPDQDYTERTVIVNSIYDQQTAYLLNASVYGVTQARFVLNDPTGEYGSKTLLYVEKPVNDSGTTQYRTIVADEFGVEGVTALLQEDRRYRIRIEAPDGSTQVIGPYRADVNETVEVKPGTPVINLENYTEGWAADASLNNDTLQYVYEDPDGQTSELTVWIHERGNKSNKLVANSTYQDPTKVSQSITLTPNESKKTWAVKFIIDRDGDTFTKQVYVSNRPDILPSMSEEWRLIAGVGLLLLLAAAFSVLNATIGAVVVSASGGILWYIGLLDGVTSGAAILLALFITMLGHMRSTSRGP